MLRNGAAPTDDGAARAHSPAEHPRPAAEERELQAPFAREPARRRVGGGDEVAVDLARRVEALGQPGVRVAALTLGGIAS